MSENLWRCIKRIYDKFQNFQNGTAGNYEHMTSFIKGQKIRQIDHILKEENKPLKAGFEWK